ncbi:hypothetical protein D0Z08_01710 [Nocardioides immobilis]|uniref:CoA transferase n=1 Tax=Nocardioides immobilis TaxID=2049295 RepID=A0A417Y818_9ACTN|nr:CoA transferase [Nocardioides immobilis]RHW28604.1 hypothetical protein D0Z08_01710 [Nocardioides immobilis]
MPSSEVLRDWAASGAWWLTGRAEGPPRLPPGRAASVVRKSLASLGARVPEIPQLLSERAAYTGFGRNAPWSCGGAFRILPTKDGWLGISLARLSDLELVPALIEAPVARDAWPAVTTWAASITAVEAEARLGLLGLPGGAVPTEAPRDRAGVVATALGARRVNQTPLVVDLTSLWAGPLCAQLLGLQGARVIKVESTQRPDGARLGPPAFFEMLHAGHEQVVLDFATEIDQLRALIGSADLVLEASRPRAMRQLGILAEEAVARGTSWLSITARGRASDTVGFGDDVAASAGLVIHESGSPSPAGDAIADPLSGVAAAVAATAALASEDARLIDVSMQHVAAETLVPSHDGSAADEDWGDRVVSRDGEWWVDTGHAVVLIERPRPR